MKTNVDCPVYDCKKFDVVPFIDSVGVNDTTLNEFTLFVLNRSLNNDIMLSIDCRSMKLERVIGYMAMEGYGLKAVNSKENSFAVVPRLKPIPAVENGKMEVVLGKASWNVLRFQGCCLDL